MSADFSIDALANQDWIVLSLDKGNQSIQASLYADLASNTFNLGTVAVYRGLAYEWTNVALQGLDSGSRISFSLNVEAGTMLATVTDLTDNQESHSILYYFPSNSGADPGRNESNYPPDVSLNNYSLSFLATNPGLTLTNLSVSSIPPVTDVLVSSYPRIPLNISATISYKVDGDITIQLNPQFSSFFVILGYPTSSLWEVDAGGGVVHSIDTFGEANAFLVQNATTGTISLAFMAALNQGLALSISVTVVSIALVSFILVSRRVRSR